MKIFLCRICIILPAVVFAVFVLFILAGILSSTLGAGEVFYSSFFGHAGVAFLAIAVTTAIYTQVKACCKSRIETNPPR